MPPNLLLVLVDALRADRVGFAGHAAARTPFLDALAARGVVHARCFSPCGWTLPACASIVTGRLPSEHGLVHHHRRFAAPKIGALLGDGWATLGVANNGNLVPDDVPAEVLENLGFERRPEVWRRFGWQEGFGTYRWFHKEDKAGPFRAFSEWIAGRGAGGRGDDVRPWFAMLHTNLVHDYDHGDPWCLDVEPFLGRPLHPALRKFRDGPFVWKDPPDGLTIDRLREELLAKYDACVAEADRRLAEALAPIDLARTVVVVTSDHGEGFDGGRQRVHHCGRMHDDLLRVPLVVSYPPGTPGAPPPGTRVDAPCTLLDVAPTLLALAGRPAAGLPGADLRALPAERTLVAEDFGYLYAPPGDVSEPFRRYEYKTHDVALRTEIRWPRKRIDARIGRQSWAEEYDLELDPEERINAAPGAQGPLRKPERDEGALAATVRSWRRRSAGPLEFASLKSWNRFVRRMSGRRTLPRSDRFLAGQVNEELGMADSPLRYEVRGWYVPMTFVVAVDDPAELRRHVLASRCFQAGGHQWLFVENRGNRAYSSISRLYADATRRANHEFICYAHQDVLFPPDWDERIWFTLVRMDGVDPNWGVIGVAGRAPETGSGEPPNIGHWSDPHKYHEPDRQLPAEAQILDELLLIVRKSSGLAFDPDLPGFHCYGADLCLSARDRGMKSWVVDAPVVHKLWRPDGTLIERSDQSQKIAGRRTDAFRADFERSADYVARKWAKFLPFRSTSFQWGQGCPSAFLENDRSNRRDGV